MKKIGPLRKAFQQFCSMQVHDYFYKNIQKF